MNLDTTNKTNFAGAPATVLSVPQLMVIHRPGALALLQTNMKTEMIVRQAIEQARKISGLNIHAWCSNNAGKSGSQIHVALCEPGVERATMFRRQPGMIRDGFTGHWHGLVSPAKLIAAIS